MAKRTWWVGAVVLLAAAPRSVTGDAGAAPALTRDVPRVVTQTCASVRSEAPLPLVCPPLVPVTRYRTFPGLHGGTLGTWFSNYEAPANRFYLVGFNGGDSGPLFWHWSAGMGTTEAIRAAVLSDAFNEVKGRPKLLRTLRLGGRRVVLWRFPDYPAGGQFGGHVVAITPSGPYLAVASVHGYDTSEESARMAVALARAADAARARAGAAFAEDGIALRYPRGWTVTGLSTTNRPRRLAIASYRVPKGAVEGDCGGHGVVERLPAAGVAVILVDYGSSLSFPRRPPTLDLERGQFAEYECFGPSTMFRFSVAGRDLQAHVVVGPRTPRARVANAIRVLETLTVARAAARG